MTLSRRITLNPRTQLCSKSFIYHLTCHRSHVTSHFVVVTRNSSTQLYWDKFIFCITLTKYLMVPSFLDVFHDTWTQLYWEWFISYVSFEIGSIAVDWPSATFDACIVLFFKLVISRVTFLTYFNVALSLHLTLIHCMKFFCLWSVYNVILFCMFHTDRFPHHQHTYLNKTLFIAIHLQCYLWQILDGILFSWCACQ